MVHPESLKVVADPQEGKVRQHIAPAYVKRFDIGTRLAQLGEAGVPKLAAALQAERGEPRGQLRADQLQRGSRYPRYATLVEYLGNVLDDEKTVQEEDKKFGFTKLRRFSVGQAVITCSICALLSWALRRLSSSTLVQR
jgi:hypothetical protein